MKISSKPSKLVDIKLELKSLIDPLVGQEKLSSIEIFNRTDKVENFVLKAALSFELQGNFEAAIDLYEQVANALIQASEEESNENRNVISSLAKLWSSTAESKRSAEPMKPDTAHSLPIVEPPKRHKEEDKLLTKVYKLENENNMIPSPISRDFSAISDRSKMLISKPPEMMEEKSIKDEMKRFEIQKPEGGL